MSFPKIFPHHHDITSLSAFSSLSSNPTTVISQLKSAEEDARRIASLEEREQLINAIGEISSHYEEDELDLE